MGDRFGTWGILEIMGHKTFAGFISEEEIAGKGFIRIDVPAVGKSKSFTKLFGTGSVYGITPTDEVHAKAAAETFSSSPMDLYTVTEWAEKIASEMVRRDAFPRIDIEGVDDEFTG